MDDPDLLFEQLMDSSSSLVSQLPAQPKSSVVSTTTIRSASLFDDLMHSSVFDSYSEVSVADEQIYSFIDSSSAVVASPNTNNSDQQTFYSERSDAAADQMLNFDNGEKDVEKNTDLQSSANNMNNCPGENNLLKFDSIINSGGLRPEIDIVIQNVVSSFSTGCHLNLRKLASESVNVIYKRQQAMVSLKLRKPPVTASIWSSGKVSVTGARSEDEAKVAARRVARLIQQAGFAVKFRNFRIVNVLGTCSFPFGIHIADFSRDHKQNASYEPELHPGVTYRIKDPKATAKIFSTGSITVTAPRVTNVISAIEHLYPLVRQYQRNKQEAAAASIPVGLHLLPSAGAKTQRPLTTSRTFNLTLKESSSDDESETDSD